MIPWPEPEMKIADIRITPMTLPLRWMGTASSDRARGQPGT